MPERYQVPDSEITLATDSGTKELTQIVKQLMLEDHEGDEQFQKEIKTKKLNFMVNETFMNLTLQELLEDLKLSTESTVQVYYLFALDKPKPKQSTPCDEWISKICPLAELDDTKARSYAVAFFNGDVKLFGP